MKLEKVKVNIYLIRHGEKNPDGFSLSVKGKKQVEHLFKKFKKIKFDKIYSSDLNRCVETAKIVSKYHKKDVIYDKNLREVGGNVKDFFEKFPKEIKNIRSFWNKVTKDKGNILIVSSGNLNRILISIALKIKPINSRFVQNPTGLTRFEYINKNKTRIVCVNDLSHLPEKLKIRQAY